MKCGLIGEGRKVYGRIVLKILSQNVKNLWKKNVAKIVQNVMAKFDENVSPKNNKLSEYF